MSRPCKSPPGRQSKAVEKQQLSQVALEPYEPNEQERAVLQAIFHRRESSPPSVRFKVETGDNGTQLAIDHADQAVGSLLLCNALGTANLALASGLVKQLADVARTGQAVTSSELAFVMALISDMRPRDATEALLLTQMAAVHNATVVAARKLNHVSTIQQQDSASNMLNKLARTFAAQVETLKKYRSTGEQSIKVQHVTVADGGQAVIGNVQTGGGVSSRNGGQPHEPCRPYEQSPPLLGNQQAHRGTMPCSSHERVDSLPLPRGTGRGAKGPG